MENTPSLPEIDTNKIIEERRAKLTAIRATGIAFPNDFVQKDLASSVSQAHQDKTHETLDQTPIAATLAGRIMFKRVMGKACFASLQDTTGRMQLYLSEADTGKSSVDLFKHYDIGDIIGVSGILFKTKTGELTLRVKTLRLLTKSLRPLPEKFHGLTDQEIKYRQRYVDLIVNEDTRNTFRKRSRIIQTIRDIFNQENYLEVETPMMQAIPGGAAAKPFITHHNALDMALYLRIAPELYLKRLVVGGFERVFEINRNFRNEGMSTRHNPEFTMLEFYCAYMEVNGMMDFIEKLIRQVAETTGSAQVNYQGHSIDFAKPYQRLTIAQAITQYSPHIGPEVLEDKSKIIQALKKLGEEMDDSVGLGALQLALFEHTAETQLINPTFLIDYPAEVSPLARRNDKRPEVTERFELFIAGREIANGFSELNDPEDQAERFLEQVKQKEAGDDEAMHYDADYIRALEYGLPPTAGAGIGIDRLVMLLTDSPSIRDVILFPQMRPE
jgi:lysyl-tRNA synthetase class 2